MAQRPLRKADEGAIMAGKKGMKGSGGKREGAGRPKGAKGKAKLKGVTSEERKKSINEALEKVAAEEGMTADEAIVRMLYNDKVQDSVKAGIWKSLLEATVVKETKSEIDLNAVVKPKIYLPKRDPNPASEKPSE